MNAEVYTDVQPVPAYVLRREPLDEPPARVVEYVRQPVPSLPLPVADSSWRASTSARWAPSCPGGSSGSSPLGGSSRWPRWSARAARPHPRRRGPPRRPSRERRHSERCGRLLSAASRWLGRMESVNPVGMQIHKVFNLSLGQDEFQLLGYRFQKVANYEQVSANMFRKSRITRDFLSGRWVETQRERPGQQAHTFDAHWVGDGAEPGCRIHLPEVPLIHDLCLALSFMAGTYVCTGERVSFHSPTYHGQRLADTDREVLRAAEKFITSVPDHATALRAGVYPGLFLLHESYRTEIVTFQTLFVSPAVDLVSAGAKVERGWTDEQTAAIAALKERLLGELGAFAAGAEWASDVTRPLRSTIESMHAAKAADKLASFLATTPALANIKLSPEVLRSHARAFNQFRNAALHYAGFPESVEVLFEQRPGARIKKGADYEKVVLGMTYYTHAFRDLLLLHFVRSLGSSLPHAEEKIEETLAGFFQRGIYNGANWLVSAFKDEIDFMER